jgi:hypothetical protein
VTTSRLDYTIATDPKQPATIAAIWLHSGTPEKPSAARHQLFHARAQATPAGKGTVTLSSADRRDLSEGRVSIRFYPSGTGELVTIHLSEMRAWK